MATISDARLCLHRVPANSLGEVVGPGIVGMIGWFVSGAIGERETAARLLPPGREYSRPAGLRLRSCGKPLSVSYYILSCDEMQGYLFSKPVPGEDFEAKIPGAATLRK